MKLLKNETNAQILCLRLCPRKDRTYYDELAESFPARVCFWSNSAASYKILQRWRTVDNTASDLTGLELNP